MPKQNLRSKNPHNQFLLDKMLELKHRCIRTGQQKVSFIYHKIIQSLQKYPMPILCEDQVQMLQGVGDKTAIVLLQLIKLQYKDYEVPYQKINQAIVEDNLQIIAEGDEELDDQFYAESCPPCMIFPEVTQKRNEIPPQSMFAQHLKKYVGTAQDIEPISKNKRPYNPGKDSKGGQILLGLHKFSKNKNKLFASKKEIRDEIRDLCNIEIQSWTVISALEKNQLISKTVLDNEVKYALTEQGTKLGEQYLVETRLHTKAVQEEQPPKIILLIDNRERFQNNNRQIFFEKLSTIYNIDCKMSQLPIGDFMWICQKGDEEYVCDYIIERKTVCDLANSILDKRYQVQKYRLKNCGISNLFYLIENTYSSNLPVPKGTVDKAIRNTQIKDGFFIKQTENVEDSLRWLALFTKTVKLHENPMKFSEFLFNNSKRSESLFNLWGSMLRGIHGVGLETAKVIANTWRTPIEFFEAANQDESKSLQQLIEQTSTVTRQVPSNVLRQIEILFTKDQYPN